MLKSADWYQHFSSKDQKKKKESKKIWKFLVVFCRVMIQITDCMVEFAKNLDS